MKTILPRIFIFLFLFSFQTSFAQTITKKRGKVTSKYANGNKESSGKVKHYEKQGVWKYWDDSGKLERTVTYKDDKKNGLFTSYWSNGKKLMEGNYIGGRKNGEWNSWNYDGKLSAKLNYDGINFTDEKLDVYTGIQQWWFDDGRIQEQSNYENKKLVYDWTWFENGRPKEVRYFKDGLPDGTWRKYADPKENSDTLPVSIDNYADGKKNGLHAAYAHGKLSEEMYYTDDKLNGTSKKWDSGGMLSVSENYVNGNRDGLCKYFTHGRCIREVIYSNGKINGSEKEFDDEEKLFRMSWYNQGRIDSANNYFGNGQKSISRIYKYYPGFVKTEQFSDYTEWDAQGHLLLKGTYHFETKTKDWTTYYPNGKVKSITPYSEGKISGVYKKWYANGKELIEMECDGNEVTTAPKVWDENGKPIKAGTKKYEEIVDSSKPGEIYNDPKKYKENRTLYGSDEVFDQIDPAPVESSEEIFTYAEQMPQYVGGDGGFMQYLQKNIKYPGIEREAGKQGTVYIRFVVERDGSITNVEAVKEVPGAPGFTKEAIRVISQMPKWNPAKQNGRTIRLAYTQPVRFQLQ